MVLFLLSYLVQTGTSYFHWNPFLLTSISKPVSSLFFISGRATGLLKSIPGYYQVSDSSVGKESTCSAGDPSSIPRSGRHTGEGIGLRTPVFLGFPCGSTGKEFPCNAGDLGSIPGFRRSPGEGKDYLLQYSGLENPRDYIVHGVAKSQT